MNISLECRVKVFKLKARLKWWFFFLVFLQWIMKLLQILQKRTSKAAELALRRVNRIQEEKVVIIQKEEGRIREKQSKM